MSAQRARRDGGIPRLASLLLLAAAAAAGCHASVDHEARHLLVDDLSEVERASQQTIGTRAVELGFDRRASLYQHPPSAFRFEGVPSGPGARLRTGLGLDARAREAGSDGVAFLLRCRGPTGAPVHLHRAAVAPAPTREEARWHDLTVSLAACSAPSTWLELQTDCGPAEACTADWAYWGLPLVENRRQARVVREPLVLLISIDTLRPDHTEPYGGRATPALARLTRDGIVFETAVSHAPWTIPSHAALFTSRYPHLLGAAGDAGIPPEVPTLAEVFRAAGWQTAGFVDHDWLTDYGFPRGFAHYTSSPPARGLARRGVSSNQQQLLDWIVGREPRPGFVFWHIMDVHGPYGAPAPFGGAYRRDVDASRSGFAPLALVAQLGIHDYLELDRFRTVEDLVAGYDEGVLKVDAAIGELLDFLAAAGLYEDATIVVTSDHGESFLEQGVMVGHGLSLRDVEIRVPLIVKLPGRRHAGTRVAAMVRHIDVAPSLLDVAGVAPPPSFLGHSLLSPAPGASGTLAEVSFGSSANTGAMYARTRGWKVISRWTHARDEVVRRHFFPKDEASPLLAKLDPGEKVFDLARDPHERHNLVASAAALEEVAALRAWLAREQAAAPAASGPGPAPSREERERLRALGYIVY